MSLKSEVKEKALGLLISMIMKYLTEDKMKEWVDAGLDKLEERVAESGTKLDDVLVLPAIKLVRSAFGVEDND